jgi:two-component system chemotaxis response regulator CheY
MNMRAHNSASKTAMIIDRSASMRSFTAERIMELGFRVLEAGTARGAIDYFERFEPVDLVLIDCQPENTTAAFIRAVRSDFDCNLMKLIVVAAACDVVHMPQLLDAGADSYVLKPFDRETLIEKLINLGVMPAHRAPQRGELPCEL